MSQKVKSEISLGDWFRVRSSSYVVILSTHISDIYISLSPSEVGS